MKIINNKTKKDMLLTEPISKSILLFSIPIFIGNLFQQLYNISDTLIVGNFLGSSSLAAVSSSTSLILLMIGFFDGLSVGSGVVIARYFGNKDIQNMKKSIHTCVAFGIILGILLTTIGVLFTPYILLLMDTPDEILQESIIYFRVYFMGSFFFVMYNIFANILRSVGDSVHPLQFLIISSLVNIVLDYILVGAFKLGVGAAAFATITSQAVSAILCFIFLLKQILANGIPAGFQGSIISLANVVVQSNVNRFGEYAVAGNGAYEKISGFTFLPITCFSLAMSTFISQNLGAKNIKRVKKGAIFGIISCVIVSEIIGLTIYFTIPYLMTFFTDNSEVIAFGIRKGKICSIFSCLLAFSHVMSGILRGAGKSYVPMFIMALCWCVIRVTYLTMAIPLFPNMDTISWAYPLTWSLSSLIFIIYYLRLDLEKLK